MITEPIPAHRIDESCREQATITSHSHVAQHLAESVALAGFALRQVSNL